MNAPSIRCVTCRRTFTGTVADVVADYRNHRCIPYSAPYQPPPLYSRIGNYR